MCEEVLDWGDNFDTYYNMYDFDWLWNWYLIKAVVHRLVFHLFHEQSVKDFHQLVFFRMDPLDRSYVLGSIFDCDY